MIVSHEHMAPEVWKVAVDYTPALKDLLWDDALKKPRKLWALVYDTPVSGGSLLYPPLELFMVDGDEEGLVLGGLGILHSLGSSGIGPMIIDREYVTGADKLSNGGFYLGELYWTRPSQGSGWTLASGTATKTVGVATDDVLLYDRNFPTRPGYTYQARMAGVTGTGRLRLRTIYEGRFNPANLLEDGGFELNAGFWTTSANIAIVASGARTGTRSMRIRPIPLPQLISNSGFESGTVGWAVGPTMTVGSGGMYAGTVGLIATPNPKPQLISNSDFAAGSVGWTIGGAFSIGSAFGGYAWGSNALIALPNPQPQLIADPGFESGTGSWSQTTGTAGDMEIAAGGAYAGSRAMRIGPVTRQQLIADPGFESHTTYWFQNPPAQFIQDARGPFEGTFCGTTEGAPGGPVTKQLQTDTNTSVAGSQVFNVVPGETYEFSAMIRRDSGATGYAFITAHLPHPTNAAGDIWRWGFPAITEDAAGDVWYYSTVPNGITVPPGRTTMRLLAEVWENYAGRWSFDNITLTRTRGNIARMVLGTSIPVTANNEYSLRAKLKSDNSAPSGSVRLGVLLSGPGKVTQEREVSQDETDFSWADLRVDVRPETGYTTATVYVRGVDVLGGSFYLDEIQFLKTSNNTSETRHTAVALTPDQRYLLTADVAAYGATSGEITVGITLSGPGVPNQDVEVRQGVGTDSTSKHLSTEVRPAAGYTTGTPYVRSRDIEGGIFVVDNVRLTKADNNTDETTHTSFPIVADQRYLLSGVVRSASAATKGRVTVGLRLTGAGLPTQSVDVSHELTKGEWKGISQEVRAPTGYTTAVPFVLTTDIEGGNFSVDNVTLTKSDNNSEAVSGITFAVVPERTYRWTQAVRSGTNLRRGSVKLSVTCLRTGHPNVVFDSPAMENTAGQWKFIDFTFTPPSGYHQVSPSIIGTDVEGDEWNVDDGEIRDTDTNTFVFQTWLDSPSNGAVNLPTTAPAGAKSLRVAVVADGGSGPWTVDAVSLTRTGVTPATGATIVGQLLAHPQTGQPLPITAGTITAPSVITADWVIQNQTNRAALDHLCNVVYPTLLEYRVLPTYPATINVGPANVVCTTHPMADALLPEDRDVEDLSAPTTDTSERPTQVTVLGAEFQTASGQSFLITATAAVPGMEEKDIAGRPIIRTKFHNDATVDHIAFAEALAADLAEREAAPALAVSVKLSGKGTRPFLAGDTVYAWHPESGLSDADNSVVIEGNTVSPRAARVLKRERVHGPSHRIVMRSSDGTEFPLTGVRWSEEDATVLTIGDRLPEWLADPQGHAEGLQYLRDRASRPR